MQLLTMDQMAMPPIVTAALTNNRLHKASVRINRCRRRYMDLLVYLAPGSSAAVEQLQRRCRTEQTDDVAQRHEARAERPRHDVADPLLKERVGRGDGHCHRRRHVQCAEQVQTDSRRRQGQRGCKGERAPYEARGRVCRGVSQVRLPKVASHRSRARQSLGTTCGWKP